MTGLALTDLSSAIRNHLDANLIEELRMFVYEATRNGQIAVVDREGNILAVVRMDDPRFPAAETTVRIRAGGRTHPRGTYKL